MSPTLDFQKAEFSQSYGLASQLPSYDVPEFVFAGRSNVGKSSLINKLCNRKKLARTSSTPGKTATINYYSAGDVYLVDLPGYGYAKTSMSERRRWDSLINGYFSKSKSIVLVIVLLDSRHEPSKEDYQMMEYLQHYNLPFCAVLTKYDKIKPSKRDETAKKFSKYLSNYNMHSLVNTSAENGVGIPELQQIMHNRLDGDLDGI